MASVELAAVELTAPTTALSLHDVTVIFGGTTALRDVSLTLYPGEVLGLIGPNGAGKTTLFDVITGVRFPTAAESCSTSGTSRKPTRLPAPDWACVEPFNGYRRSAG